MSRSEKLTLVREFPSTIVTALDALMQSEGYLRVGAESINEDFTPLLAEEGGPIVFVLSAPQSEWVACFSSLDLDAEWDLVETLAHAIECPVVYAVFAPERGVYLYRYWDRGELHEEIVPADGEAPTLDETALLEKLATHGIDATLVDDRVDSFGAEHLVVGYGQRNEEINA